jgi:peptide/nickel transport system permease protein
MRPSQAFRELWRSGAGKSGLLLFALAIVGTLYVLLTYPANYGEQIWSNPTLWVDNPKAAPPFWVNRLRKEPLPEHQVLETTQPNEVRIANAGQVQFFRLALPYLYRTPPTFLAVTLANVTFAERAPLITLTLLRPDGKEVRLLRHAVRGPREGEVGLFRRYDEDPLRIQLSSDESTVGAIQEFLEKEFNLRLGIEEIQGRVEQILFGAPASDGKSFEPLRGDYQVEVRATFRSKDDALGKVRFVAGGGVYGWLGADTLGRDLAQGLLFGLPVALFIGLVVAILETSIGVVLGLISGYAGGLTDLAIQRFSDIVANVPLLPLLLFMLFIIGPSLGVIIFVLVAFSWPGLTIQIRSMVQHLRTHTLVEAIQSLGASSSRVMFRHILPQIAPYVLSRFIFAAPAAILAESGLSFLGLGDPSIPTWGQILETGFRTGGVYIGYWWWIIPPGLLIALTSLAFMLISQGLEPVVNPRLRRGEQ